MNVCEKHQVNAQVKDKENCSLCKLEAQVAKMDDNMLILARTLVIVTKKIDELYAIANAQRVALEALKCLYDGLKKEQERR